MKLGTTTHINRNNSAITGVKIPITIKIPTSFVVHASNAKGANKAKNIIKPISGTIILFPYFFYFVSIYELAPMEYLGS